MWAIVRSLSLDGTINVCAWLQNRYLAVGSRAKSLTLYDTSTFLPIITVHTAGWVTSISWGGEGTVAIRSEQSCISILQLESIKLTNYKLYHDDNDDDDASSLSWSFDGRYLARICGSKILVSNALNDFHDIVLDLKEPLRCIAYCHAEGKRDLLAAAGVDGLVYVISHRKQRLECVQTTNVDDTLSAIAWSPDGSLIATGGRNHVLHILSSETLKPHCDDEPVEVDGRIWSIAFSPHGLAVGSSNDVATLFDAETFTPRLKILRPRTVRSVVYHPTLPLLAVGDGGNIVSIVHYEQEETVHEFSASGRVNCLAFSPLGDYLVVGADDCKFSVHETTDDWRVVQEIPGDGFCKTAAFSGSGKYLALGSSSRYFMVELGPFLSIDLVPLSLGKQLPTGVLQEVLYRSADGPSLIQRYMLDGSQDSLRRAAALMDSHSDTIYCFDRTTGDSCFDTALKLKKPNLLKLVMTVLVDGTLESEGDGRRSILASGMPDRGAQTLQDMMQNSPPEFIVGILSKMTYVKVPFTQAHEVDVGTTKSMECGSCNYTDPWVDKVPARHLERSARAEKDLLSMVASEERGAVYRTPAVLPLPGLGTLEFLSLSIIQDASHIV